jgi:UDP-2,4-diacetamido-2,4,6-trideoxy-beta-L-altropyranose hydrolase
MMAGTLLVRADAGVEMGSGHVMRCLALAQAWQDAGGDVVFCVARCSAVLDQALASEGVRLVRLQVSPGSLQDAIQTAEAARTRNVRWLVIDGYHFDADYRKHLRNREFQVLFLDDDGGCDRYDADMVVNQNIDAKESQYAHDEGGGSLLLGTKYVLLRREFSRRKERRRNPLKAVRKILITMGGSDPHNVTEMAIRALAELKGFTFDVTVVVGPNNPHMESLLRVKSQAPSNLQLLRNVSGMADVMAEADLAISAGGGTGYELIFFQVPTILITVAENQRAACRSLGESKVAIDAGWFHALDHQQLAGSIRTLIETDPLRQTLMENCRHVIDDQGAARVVQSMLSQGEALQPRGDADNGRISRCRKQSSRVAT